MEIALGRFWSSVSQISAQALPLYLEDLFFVGSQAIIPAAVRVMEV